MATHDAQATSATLHQTKADSDEPMVQLSKYILLLATLVSTVTYAAGFNPPGGVWQDAAPGRLAGDPIIRSTHKTRYLVFFYSNATAFASSLVVIVLVLILALLYEKMNSAGTVQRNLPLKVVVPLRGVMVLDLVSLMGAYAAATCRDTLTTIYSSVLVAVVLIYLVIQMVWASVRSRPSIHRCWWPATPPQVEASTPQAEASDDGVLKKRLRKVVILLATSRQLKAFDDAVLKKRLRKVLMLLATFAVSVTYVAGMSAPGGFWDEGGQHPGDAILKDRHGARLTVFLCCNTMAFVASLLIIVVLLDRNYRVKQAYVWITVALISLIGAYTAGSCRETDTTVYVVSLVGAVLVVIIFLRAVVYLITEEGDAVTNVDAASREQVGPDGNGSPSAPKEEENASTNLDVVAGNVHIPVSEQRVAVAGNGNASGRRWWQGPAKNKDRKEAEKARSLVLLLATLAATITYQAGLDPPGGVWPDNGNGHMAGDPILLKTNPRRYKAFFYCNSVAFVASLVAIILVQKKLMLRTHVLEAAMILDLFGLIGAYAAGSCRDVSTSIYAMALAGAVLVYVVIHVVFLTLDHTTTDTDTDNIEKRRKRLLLFAVLAATMTYQAGLTPPGGFRLQDDWSSGHHAGDPVLLYNFPRRYTAFFYCNSVSFMLSIALIILLVNPHLYRPAIRSYALSVCTAAGMFGLMGAYAAGSTQYLKTSIYIFVLVGVVLFVIAVLVLVFLLKEMNNKTSDNATAQSTSPSGELEDTRTVDDEEKKKQAELKELHAKRKYLMLLGILVASVTYQAGLDPPGGAWQQSGDGHNAGNPVLHDSNLPRYLVFFYSNSVSFVASIVIIILLVVRWVKKGKLSFRVMNMAILLDLLALLVAYAAGSSRGWKASVYAIALVIAVLAYVAIHVALSFLCAATQETTGSHENLQSQGQGKVAPTVSSPC